MALSKVLETTPASPYFQPPPLHIFAVKEEEHVRVVSWDFQGSTARPVTQRTNKIVVVSDGVTVSKITVFEEFASKIKEGNSYILRGYTLRGEAPPYVINITKNTKFFRASPLQVSPELTGLAVGMLSPPAPRTPLSQASGMTGLVSVEGEVVEIFSVRRVRSGQEYIPVRNIRVKEDDFSTVEVLWREMAIKELNLGEKVAISHLRAASSSYGLQLQTTTFTKIEQEENKWRSVVIMGVLESAGTRSDSNPNELCLKDGGALFISKENWEPFAEELEKGKFQASVLVKGQTIQEMKLI